MKSQRTNLISSFTLLLSSVIWGFSFVAQRAGMEFVGPFTFNGIRFAVGSLVLIPFVGTLRRSMPVTGQTVPPHHIWIAIGLSGLILFVSANLQQIGLVYTSAGKAGFITGLYVVIVPLIGLFRRHRMSGFVWAGCSLAAGGLYLLSVVGAFSISAGDTLVLGSTLGWAIHVHIVSWLAPRSNPLRVAILQFAICAALSLAVAGFTETIRIEQVLQAGWMIAYAGVLSTGVGYTLQLFGQRHIAPARAGIILSLEAVFGLIGGSILLGEMLSTRGFIGCALMLTGMVLAQIRIQPSSDSAESASSS